VQANACRTRQKRYCLIGEKEMRLFICGSYADASDHTVFSVATIKKKLVYKISEQKIEQKQGIDEIQRSISLN
jgi:hypothetical protein